MLLIEDYLSSLTMSDVYDIQLNAKLGRTMFCPYPYLWRIHLQGCGKRTLSRTNVKPTAGVVGAVICDDQPGSGGRF